MKTTEKIVTKELLKNLGACESSYIYVCENNYIGLTYINGIKKCIKENRLNDANWFITKIMNKEQNIKYAIFAAEQVIDIFEEKYPDDNRPRKAIEAAKNYLKTPSSAARAAYAARAAAYAAADAAYAATYAAADAAAYAAYAAYAAAYAAYATADDAADAAAYAAYAAYATADDAKK